MTRILLPTDFSEVSLNAIQYALLVYKEVNCTFYLLHTYTPTIYNTEYLIGSPAQIGLGDVLQNNSISQLEKLKVQLEKTNSKHSFVIHSAFNTLLGEVSEIVKNENIDLIIMGTTGATGAKEILFGTNAVHIIKKSKCPVLVVPPNFKYEAPIDILFPTDYEIEYSHYNFTPFLEIVHQHQSRVNIMYVRTGYELNNLQVKNKTHLEELFSHKALFHEVPDNRVIAAVNEFQKKIVINLLVMVQNKHTFLEKLFIEPVIQKIGYHISVPFMVMPQL